MAGCRTLLLSAVKGNMRFLKQRSTELEDFNALGIMLNKTMYNRKVLSFVQPSVRVIM